VKASPRSKTPLARRRFLALVGGAAACTACSGEDGGGQQVAQDLSAGKVSDLALGDLRVVGDATCIGRDVLGIYAMSLLCTHAGCDISQSGSVSPRGLFCSCHGSSFDVHGNVLGGPAPASLPHFLVTADTSGNITVHVGQVVSASARLSV
jgi:Rieske Fe-S protein